MAFSSDGTTILVPNMLEKDIQVFTSTARRSPTPVSASS